MGHRRYIELLPVPSLRLKTIPSRQRLSRKQKDHFLLFSTTEMTEGEELRGTELTPVLRTANVLERVGTSIPTL